MYKKYSSSKNKNGITLDGTLVNYHLVGGGRIIKRPNP